MAQVRWAEHARNDLREIHDFIARDSPRAAEAMVERILTRVERLALFPESGRVVPEFPQLDYREKDTVWIVAVVHGRRLLGGEPGGP